jgi:pyridinium-3,5-bisthiocarboxylic acid mononucleotide nickel chelatase
MPPVDTDSIVVLDARAAGASGDKYLGALLDLGATRSRLDKVARVVADYLPGTKKVEVRVSSVERGGVAGKFVEVISEEEVEKRRSKIVAGTIQKGSNKLGLSNWAAEFARSVVDTLLKAESRVHGHSTDEVELHELGSADTVVDVLGTAFLIDEVGLGGVEWWSTPLPTGAGVSHFSGRDYPNPPPAVAEILRMHKIPISPSAVESELTTPTGAAITANLASHFSSTYPGIRPTKIGYGAGTREIREVANLLRIVQGERVEASHSHDEVVVLETNLDDVTGEVLGHAMERVMQAGARDVSVIPVYMKKNRPGHLFSVIADVDSSERLSQVIMEETGSLGVREIPVRRHINQRTVTSRTVNLDGTRQVVRTKSALSPEGHVLKEKVEFEDRKRLAKKTGKSLLEIDSRLARPRRGNVH